MEEVLKFIVKDLKEKALHLTKCPHDAEDLIQDTCLKMWLSGYRYRNKTETELRKIATTTMKNRAIDLHRKKYGGMRGNNYYFTFLTADFKFVDASIEEQKVSGRDLSQIKLYIEKSEKNTFEALRMSLNGYSTIEIADYYKIPLNTALTRIRYARLEMARQFSSYQNKYK